MGTIQHRRRVLVVENDDDERKSWGEALESAGFDVVIEPDPERALLTAAELRPSGVLVDLTMPGCDPLQLVSALRGHPRTRDLTVVALSDRVTLEVVALARVRGCDAVLSKNAKRPAIAAVVARLVARARRAA